MDYRAFKAMIERQAHVPPDVADRALRTTLATLARRLTKGERRDLADQLPLEIAPWILAAEGEAAAAGVDAFLQDLAGRAGVDVPTAERYARAVFAALRRALTDDEVADLAATLPHDMRPLLCGTLIVPTDEVLRRVTAHGGPGGDAARRATEAVLKTLAERIPAGEVDDLLARLPVKLHQPLLRGRPRTEGVVAPIPVEEFLRRVADREGVDVGTAAQHARAVMVALREALREEFFDVTVELPREYGAILPPPPMRTP